MARNNTTAFKRDNIPWNKGKSGVYSDETITKMKESSNGREPWNKGKTLSKEHCQKLSISHMGQVSPRKGVAVLEESKEKMRLARLGKSPWNKGITGYTRKDKGKLKWNDEQKKRMSEGRKGITAWNKGKTLAPNHIINLSIAAVDRCTGRRSHFYTTGTTYGKYCDKFTLNLRRRVRAFFNHTCVLCNKTTEENGEELSVHHVYAEKLSCCESAIKEMDEIRKFFPQEIAKFGEPEFSEEEITRIRMMVPLCKKCHAKTIFNNETAIEIMKTLDNLIMTKHSGKCFFTKVEFKEFLKDHYKITT